MSRSARLVFGLLLFTAASSSLSFAYQQIECVREIGVAGKKAKHRLLNAPRAVAVAGEKLYVADTDAHRVLVLDMDGKTLLSFGAKGDEPGRFKSPAGISVDEEGRVYVADTGNHRIQVFDAAGALLRTIGEKGSGLREFRDPAGIVAQRGFIYVADTGNSRVQIITSDGIFIRQISVKTDSEEMKEPIAVAVDVQNRVHVLDPKTNKIWIFDHNGGPLFRFGVKGRGVEGLDSPQGLAVDVYGSIFVADTGNYKLKKFDQQGRLLGSLGSKGEGPGQFRDAAGLAADTDGKVYALDAEKQTLQVFACELGDARPLAPHSPPASVSFAEEFPAEVSALAAGTDVWALEGDSITGTGANAGKKIGSRGSGPAFLKKPRGLAVDGAGNLWVADTGNDRVQKFSPEGALLQVIGKSGSGEGAFDSPEAVAVSSKSNIYVADTGNRRIQVLHPKGMFLGAFGKKGKLAGQFLEPIDLAVNDREEVFVLDRGNDRISKYNGSGALLWEAGGTGQQDGEFNKPSSMVLSADGEVYVLDAGNGRIQVFDMNGKFLRKFGSEGSRRGEFTAPQGLALEKGLRLYVGDRGNKRAQVFTLRHTPAVPKGLAAQAEPNEVKLTWNGGGETYLDLYKIYREDGTTGRFALVGTSALPSFTDAGLASNRTFRYRISSQAKEGNESVASAEVVAATPRLIPATPQTAKGEAIEKQITLTWPPNLEPYLDHYNVYRSRLPSTGFELVGSVANPSFVDKQLPDETMFFYQVTSVGRDGDESPAGGVVFAATPKAAPLVPPLEIASVAVGDLFSASYKYYESHSVGKVVIRNNTDIDFPKVKLRFSIKDFMDFPTETELELVPAGQEVERELRPVFNNKILEVSENTPLQTEVALIYYVKGEPKTVSRSFPITLYERHAMVWDRKEKLGAFVTPKDPPVADFTRAAIRPYVDAYPGLPAPLVYGRVVYDALGVMGLKYIVDPTSPFQQAAGISTVVDYLQYPRDTLARKSGDCDDLSILFAASMENLAIGTAFVDVPGHVFIMFNTGVSGEDKATLGFADELLVVHEGFVWIPVEMTMVGSSFTRAWQKGAEEYRDWTARGKVNIVSTRKSWDLFKPVTLPRADAATVAVTRDDIEKAYKDELETMAGQRLASLSAEYLAALGKDPADVPALGQLGILYGENGLYAEALEQFRKVLAVDKNNAPALNNSGNIHLAQDRLDDAKAAYEEALAAEPGEPGVMANLARVLERMGKKQEAKKLFEEAAATDPRVIREYEDLASGLGVVK